MFTAQVKEAMRLLQEAVELLRDIKVLLRERSGS